MAAEAIRWTAFNVTERTIEYLKSLPEYVSREDVFLVHSSMDIPDGYVKDRLDAEYMFRSLDAPVALCGHTHEPGMWELENNRMVINPGSVGQPRDRDPRACFAIIVPKNIEEYEFPCLFHL